MNLEVELTSDGSASGCSFTIDCQFKSEASKWIHDFDKSVKAGAKLSIKAGYVKTKEIFYGYIDEYTFRYSGDESPRIDITGIDALGYLMSLREPLYAGQKKAPELIKSILQKSVSAGFAKKVSVGTLTGFATPIVKEQVDDWTFLNTMANRYGASLFVINGEIIFDDMLTNTKPLIKLGIRGGLRNFTKRVSLAHQVGKVEIWGRDVNQKPIKGTANKVTAGSGLSGDSAAELVPALKSAVLREYSEFVRTKEECDKLAQNRLNGIAMGLVSGEGSCIGIPEMIPGRYIEIEGMDKSTSGTYFISKVRHRFDQDGYSTTFEVKGAKTE
ncbi:MAG: hypothetical protein Q3Y08_07490 [Butyricicoccus sp.]|nr:hypothetical protein [Butyricicoccus sp.]